MDDDRDYNNYKPFRTKSQKEMARNKAYKDEWGHWYSPAPVSYHPVRRDLLPKKKEPKS